MIKQAKDVYEWQVTYTDGTNTREFDEERADGRGWAEREDKPVQLISLVRDGVEVQNVLVPNKGEPVFFRRRFLIASPDYPAQGRTAHCVGWKTEHAAVYLFVFEDGSALLTNNFQAI